LTDDVLTKVVCAAQPASAPLSSTPAETPSLRILIATDAWAPQVNGVVRTLETLGAELTALGHTIQFVTPNLFKTIPLPTYSEIRLALFCGPKVRQMIDDFAPDTVHIATEGPIGLAARNHCMREKVEFTTSFHTRFPEYIYARARVPMPLTYRALRWFHRPASAVMVATPSLQADLASRGFRRLKIWSRGVDVDLFRPRPKDWLNLPRPIWLYVGRIAVEKNVEAFLKLDLPGTKLVVGDGPQTADLKSRYPKAVFVGAKFGEELARYYAASDTFVFPSVTDTFGLVVLEALASGIPVAAFPVQGPKDIIGDAPVGALSPDLGEACRRTLSIPGERCREFAEGFSWRACAHQFIANLAKPEIEEIPRRRLRWRRKKRS
jgi:glycosyltransferase involved in cell wall biosynthesis